MHVGEIWCTGWENPSLGTVMKEHRRGRVGRAVLHRNSLSRPSSSTSMKNKGPHISVHKSGILFIPGHFINGNSSFLMTLKERHYLMYYAECLQFYVLSECVKFFSFFFTVPSCSFRDTWIISLWNLFSIWLLEKELCKWIHSILLQSSSQCCSWRMCYLNKN